MSPSFSSVASSVMGEKLPTTLPGTQLVSGNCALYYIKKAYQSRE